MECFKLKGKGRVTGKGSCNRKRYIYIYIYIQPGWGHAGLISMEALVTVFYGSLGHRFDCVVCMLGVPSSYLFGTKLVPIARPIGSPLKEPIRKI